MTALNYAAEYSQALAQAYPHMLHFGALYNTENNAKYRITGANTIQIPVLSTTGRVDSDRDTIATATRNYNNSWETKVLSNHRKWSTLVHPRDIIETNRVASITNITKVYNEENKFPEMDAYTISKVYSLWTAQTKTPNQTALTKDSVLTVLDGLMEAMDEKRVPVKGRILYVTAAVKTLIKTATQIARQVTVDGSNTGVIDRGVSRIDEVEIVSVPSDLMKTAYDFTSGWAVGVGAKQIHMMLIHPSSIITPVSYEFAKLDEPNALTEGKYVYFEESNEDVFILNKKVDAINFVTETLA